MPTFLFILTALSMTFISVFKKLYKKPAPILFSFISGLFTLLFFVVALIVQNGFNIVIDSTTLFYGLAVGVFFCTSALTSLMALITGDLSLTGLFISFSLIIPTLYGIILGDQVGLTFFIGIALFLICLVFVNVKFGKKDKKPISVKWVVFVTIATISNGVSSTIQTAHQKITGGKFGSELMIVALILACIVYLIFCLATEKNKIKDAKNDALKFGCLVGVLTGLTNLLVMMFTGQNLMPVAIFFPALSGTTLLMTFLIGFFLYKEKYTLLQYVGILCGLASVILLNL